LKIENENENENETKSKIETEIETENEIKAKPSPKGKKKPRKLRGDTFSDSIESGCFRKYGFYFRVMTSLNPPDIINEIN